MKRMETGRPELALMQGFASDLLKYMVYSWDQDPDKTEDAYWDEILAAADKIAGRYKADADIYEAAKQILVGYLKALEKHRRQPQMITNTPAGLKREGNAA